MKLVLAIARRADATTAAVMDGARLFDFVRLREPHSLRLGRKLTDLASYYEVTAIVHEAGASERLGYETLELPRFSYELEVVRRALVPDYTHGDGDRLRTAVRERYPELARFLPATRTLRAEPASIIAAVALGYTHYAARHPQTNGRAANAA